MKERAAQALKVLRDTGFFNIVGAGMLNKVLVFISGIILVRVISKTDYGAYSYALTIINYFVLLNGLGASSCVVQLCVERGEANGAAEYVYRAISSIGMLWDVVLTVLIVVFALAVPLPLEGANLLLLLLSPFPILALAVELQQQRLRAKLMNSEYAIATNIDTVAVMGLSVGGAVLGSAAGLSVGRSLGTALSAFATNRLYHIKVYLRPPKMERGLVADILKMALTVCLTNAVSQALLLVGATFIGNMTGNSEMVASYSVASTIPFALLFLPGMVMTYVAPYFIRNNANRRWVLSHWGACTAGCGIMCVAVAGICIVCSGWLIPLIFGDQYDSSVGAFNILMVSFAIGATFVVPSGNILAFHRRYTFNLMANLVRLLVAAGATWVLVPLFGIEGAALGYLAATCAGSLVTAIGCVAFAGRPLASKVERN